MLITFWFLNRYASVIFYVCLRLARIFFLKYIKPHSHLNIYSDRLYVHYDCIVVPVLCFLQQR